MENDVSIEGRKTFFVCPDVSLLPEAYLEDFFARGYETYIIDDDRICPLNVKIDIILNTFRDSIFFFYIDSKANGIVWKEYIRELNSKYEDILIGVLYEKRPRDDERLALERFFLFDIGIKCGCISLEYQKSKNLMKIDQVMFANQARGRRQNIRAMCDPMSKIFFDFKGIKVGGKLLDVSQSHFSCLFPDIDCPMDVNSVATDIYFDINRLHFRANATLCMKHQMSVGMLFVFLFTKSDGTHGLEQETAVRLSQKIFQMVTSTTKAMLNAKFDEVGHELRYKREHPDN